MATLQPTHSPTNCAVCGQPLDAGATFCGNCGAPVSTEATGYQRDTPAPKTAPGASVLQPTNDPDAPPDYYVPYGPTGKAAWALALGVVAMIAWIVPLAGTPVAVVGLIAGILGRHSSRRWMAVAGIVMSVVGLVLSSVVMYVSLSVSKTPFQSSSPQDQSTSHVIPE